MWSRTGNAGITGGAYFSKGVGAQYVSGDMVKLLWKMLVNRM